jgi:lysophospholipase L1-like esterase
MAFDYNRSVNAAMTELVARVDAYTALGPLSLTTALQSGTAVSGWILGATKGSVITSNVPGITVNSAQRTYSGTPTGGAQMIANGLVETPGATGGATKSTSISIAAAAATPTPSPTPTPTALNGYYANGATNPKLKAAIARVTSGTGRGMIVYAGDSITTGQGGGTGTNGITGARPFRFPSKIAELLTQAGIPTLDNGIESDNGAYVGGSSLAGYDPRVTAGGWQNSAGMNFSGGGFLRPSPDSPLTLAIPAVDTFVVIPYNSAVVNYTAQIDGAAPASGGSFSSTSAGSFTKAEVKAGSLGSHTISLLGSTSGAFRSIRAYNSAQSAFDTSVHSALGASSSQQASTGGTNWNAVEALKFDAPDLTIIMVGTNDMFNAVAISTYTGALQTLVNAGKVSGDVLLVFPPPGNGRYNTNVSDYNAAAKGVAASSGVAFFSFWEYYGPFTTDFAARLYDAQVHPKAELYAEMGGLIKQAIDLMRS